MKRILLLDNCYQPIKIISWKKAISLYCLNKVEIIEEYKDSYIRSKNWTIKLPAVVKLCSVHIRPRKSLKFSRKNVLVRDKFKCQYFKQNHGGRQFVEMEKSLIPNTYALLIIIINN